MLLQDPVHELQGKLRSHAEMKETAGYGGVDAGQDLLLKVSSGGQILHILDKRFIFFDCSTTSSQNRTEERWTLSARKGHSSSVTSSNGPCLMLRNDILSNKLDHIKKISKMCNFFFVYIKK